MPQDPAFPIFFREKLLMLLRLISGEVERKVDSGVDSGLKILIKPI